MSDSRENDVLEPSEEAVIAAYSAMATAIWQAPDGQRVPDAGLAAIRAALQAAYAIDRATRRSASHE